MSAAGAARSVQWALAVIAGVAFVSLSLHLPLSLFTVAGHDDALFWKLAESIASFGWLGAYDQMTLAKGPGFSLLLALNRWLGTPITLLLALVQLACATVLVRELRAWGLSRSLGWVTWLVIVFQPAALPSRVVRDYWYQALTLVAVAGFLHLARRSHRGSTWVPAAAFGVGAGLLWITREEGIWVVPAALLLLIGTLKARWRDRDELLRFGERLGAYGGACLLTVGLVAGINLLRYGTFSVVDIKHAPFVQTLRALNSIQTSNPIPYVPVNRQQRELAYAASPAFRELQGYLERDDLHWKKHGCALYPPTCGDFAGGWFLWALRDAAAESGHFASPAHADRYFARVAAEIDDACSAGRLTCATHGLPFLPRMTADAWDRLLPAIDRAVRVSLYGEVPNAVRAASHGPEDRFLAFREFLGWPRAMPIEHPLRITGWFVDEADRWIELVCGEGEQARVTGIARQSSPDLIRALDVPHASRNRFDIEVRAGSGSDCVLRVIGSDAVSARLGELRSRSRVDLGSGAIAYVDWSSGGEKHAAAIRAVQMLVTGFAAIAPWLVVTALLAAAWGGFAFVGSRQCPPLLAAGVVCWVLAATRVVLLALVDATSFPGISMVYLVPATQLWFVGALCLVGIPFAASQASRQERHDPAARESR